MLTTFLSGAITMGFLLCALCFLRFWKRTEEGLFLTFAIAFGLLGLTQALLALGAVGEEERSWLFIPRLIAFLLIAYAIVAKNRQEDSR